jgi:hypothetical protein
LPQNSDTNVEKPGNSKSKQTWIQYIEAIFACLDANPHMFNSLEGTTGISSGHHTHTGTSSMQEPAAAFAASTVPRFVSNQSLDGNSISSTHHTMSLSAGAGTGAPPSIDYFNGIECIDIIKYDQGIPNKLLKELHRVSYYKGYPSRLRHKQVEIKQENQSKPQTCASQQDVPQTPLEMSLVNALCQMGFQDVQEIMMSMRIIQEQTQNQIVGSDTILDMIMMHIVHEREEKEEARKMDDARIQSENSMILQECEDSGDNSIEIVYSANEILGAEGHTSQLFQESCLLKSPKVKRIFRSLLHRTNADGGVVQKLLTIEKKCLKWYGTITEPFFRYILCEKIESFDDDMDMDGDSNYSDAKHNLIMEKLDKEMKSIEHNLYVISDESEHLRAPRMFTCALETALSKGLISQEIVIDE